MKRAVFGPLLMGLAFAAASQEQDRSPAARAGDPLRGRAIVADRQVGMCLLCHRAPIPEERLQGDLGPDLAGAGARWTPMQLRARIVDARQFDPQTIMPPYRATDGLERVGAHWRGRPLLNDQQIEDVVAFLATLRDTTTPR